MGTVADLCADIEQRRADRLDRKRTAYPRNNPIASDLGPCVRETVLAIRYWDQKPLFPVDLMARFERGNLIEDAVINELSTLGISVRVDRKPFEVRDKQGRLILRGKIDGFVSDPPAREEYPMEVKSLHPLIFQRVNSVADFGKFGFMAKYPRQLQSYLFAEEKEEGFFLLDNGLGAWKLLPVPLDYEEAERILQQCEAAVEHLENGTLPDYHDEAEECRKCWAYGRVCEPPISYAGLSVIDDGELEAKLQRLTKLEAAKKEYEALDKEVKKTLSEVNGSLCGDWLIEGKWVEFDRKAVPATHVKYWKPKWTNVVARNEEAA